MANFKAFYNEAKYIFKDRILMIMLDAMLMALMRRVIFIFQK